ncbi:Alpha-1,4-glucan:maltose-1-phosphate maltosyltransferase [Bordetella sputigena]|uniref:maltotransferase domain-containing protein n=1 Tax=Bordetella sputigena TaxID=1416810 RepID=UPI0039EFDF39
MRIYYVHPVLAGPLTNNAAGRWPAICARAKALGFDTLMVAPLGAPDPAGNPYVPSDPGRLNPALGELALDETLATLSSLCDKHRLALMVDLVLDRVAAGGAMAHAHPDWYEHPDGVDALRDPRKPLEERHALPLRRDGGVAPAGFIADWVERLGLWVQNGVAGFRCMSPHHLNAPEWRDLMEGVRAVRPDTRFLAWTPGLNPEQTGQLAGAGFDGVFSSLPWWDYRSPWLMEEYTRLRLVAPVIAAAEAPYAKRVAAWRHDQHGRYLNAARAIWTAAVVGDAGIFVPMGFEDSAVETIELDGGDGNPDQWYGESSVEAASRETAAPGRSPRKRGSDIPESDPHPTLHGDIAMVNQWLTRTAGAAGPLRSLLGPLSPVTALFRGDGHPYALPGNGRAAARLVVLNPDDYRDAPVDWDALGSRLPDTYARLDMWDADQPARDLPERLAPGAIVRLGASRLPPVRMPASDEGRTSVTAAMRAPRAVIERVTPAVDDGAFPVKRVVDEPIQVEADVFMDGHEHIAVALLWRAADEREWRREPMTLLNNDRWQGEFVPRRNGRHYFVVQAWSDTWHSFTEGYAKKHEAGVDVALETAEGRQAIADAVERLPADSPAAQVLQHALRVLGHEPEAAKPRRGRRKTDAAPPPVFAAPTPEQVAVLLAEETTEAMRHADARPFETTTPVEYAVTVDRPAARFSSWYEIFPRSQTDDPRRHGTFDDVIRELPRIRAMGFDTLYFPPIHPIGRRNRKGRNNTLKPGPDDPGSPYAIGAEEGGHDALHPQLGTLADFKRLIDAAHRHELEIALDFAIQCSPDHPWLKEHPEWFDWRPDGSLKYAENPPKKYEDIVNVDFYGPQAGASRQAGLWRALRDVVLFWVAQGVRTFRVDNPHTKPLPFWQWLIADVQSRHPETLFLSEAFTRPKMMYRLAKVGFSQSYTYFTWRDTKQELTEYLTELNAAPPAEFFRPHFFVNTPDINPRFLQSSGRGGFLIRAALAATLSGLWGVYNGFELCEATPVPGKEEYLDSEKYQIRIWDHDRPGNIVREVTQLNAIRRANPALHTHLGLRFHSAFNDNVLFFSKATPERDNVVLVAISLDPHNPQTAQVDLPLWEFGLPDHGTLYADDLVDGGRQSWQGRQQTIYLHPGQPYRIWRVAGMA